MNVRKVTISRTHLSLSIQLEYNRHRVPLSTNVWYRSWLVTHCLIKSREVGHWFGGPWLAPPKPMQRDHTPTRQKFIDHRKVPVLKPPLREWTPKEQTRPTAMKSQNAAQKLVRSRLRSKSCTHSTISVWTKSIRSTTKDISAGNRQMLKEWSR